MFSEKIGAKTVILAIAWIELAIGGATLAGVAWASVFSFSEKPLNILVFVSASSVISILLGAGLLRMDNRARRLLMFFSGWVILTKLLAGIGVLEFSGELIKYVSDPLKNAISVIYHAAVIFLLNSETFKREFGDTRRA